MDVFFYKMGNPEISEDAAFSSPLPARLEFLSTEERRHKVHLWISSFFPTLKNSFFHKKLFLNTFLIPAGILCWNTTCSWYGTGRRSGRSKRKWSTSVTACTARHCTPAGTGSAGTMATSNQVIWDTEGSALCKSSVEQSSCRIHTLFAQVKAPRSHSSPGRSCHMWRLIKSGLLEEENGIWHRGTQCHSVVCKVMISHRLDSDLGGLFQPQWF